MSREAVRGIGGIAQAGTGMAAARIAASRMAWMSRKAVRHIGLMTCNLLAPADRHNIP